MRYLLLAFLALSFQSVYSATLDGVPITLPSGGIEDNLMEDSLICDSARVLIDTKETTLMNYATKNISEITRQIENGNCDVVFSRLQGVVIKRLVRGYLTGINGDLSSEILLEIEHNGETLGWTESLNVEFASGMYEDAKKRMDAELQ